MTNLSEYEVTGVECKWDGYGYAECDWYSGSEEFPVGRCVHCVGILRCFNVDLLTTINDALKIFDNKE